jgi:hypothetical protein
MRRDVMMSANKDEQIQDLQDRFFNLMHDYANLLVWLQLEHPDVYNEYKTNGYTVTGVTQ